MFKKNNIISKLFVSLIVVAFSLTTLYLPFKVEASQIETRAVYNYTVSEDHVLNDGRSYVTVKLTISHNMNTNKFYLTNVTLPKTIETIDRLAFANCDRLTAISLPDKVRHIGSESFKACESLTSIHLPESVEEIEYSVFFYCRNLSYINLPAGLKYLDFSAFSDCINLDIYSYVVNPDQLSYDNGLGDYIMFYVPKGTMEAYIDRFPWLSDQIREMD